jgi:enediyne biosynthesis protein E4
LGNHSEKKRLMLFFYRRIFIFHFLIINLALSNYGYSQPHLVLDTIFLENHNVFKVTSGLDGDLWFLADSNDLKIYHLDLENNLQDRTAGFSTIISKGITDIAGLDNNELLIGTATDFAWHYKNGQFTRIDINCGLQPTESHINSVFYKRDKTIQYGELLQDKSVYGIATNGYSYSSDSLYGTYKMIYNDYFYFFPTNERFLSKEDPFLMTVTIPPIISVYEGSSHGLGSFDSDTCIVQCANVIDGFNIEYHVGTNKGMLRCGNTIYLDTLSIFSIVDYTYGGLFIATNKGLFYQIDNLEPVKIHISGPDFIAYSITNYKGCYYVATSRGIFKLKDTSCNNFSVSFDQNKQYLGINENDSLKLFPDCIKSTDSYHWDFGDGYSSTLMHPSHKYLNVGNYVLKLVASNGYCTDSATSFITVFIDSLYKPLHLERSVTNPFNISPIQGGTINIADVNGDYKQDVFLPSNGLYLASDSSEFTLEKKSFDVDATRTIWGDLNNDGLNDLICGNIIYINFGDNNFKMKEIFLFEKYQSHCCLLDYDNDGLLDIAIVFNDNGFFLYRNLGNFEFEKVENIFSNNPYITSIKWFDIDNDNDNDLLFMRYIGSNQVYLNDSGKYKLDYIAGLSDFRGMGGSVADINNDGFQDVYFDDDYNNYLLINNNGSYEINKKTWLTNEYFTLPYYHANLFSGSVFGDFDNNGFQDCFIYTDDNKSRVFMNFGNLIFVNDSSEFLKKADIVYSGSVSAADLTGEGSLDILLAKTSIQYYCFLNKEVKNNWVKLFCIGTKSNYNAIGAKVKIKANINGEEMWQTRIIETSSGKFAQSGYELHFGLGDASLIDSLVVYWPSGLKTIRTNMMPDRDYKIIEPEIRYLGNLISCENEDLKFKMPLDTSIQYYWYRNSKLINSTSCFFEVDTSGEYYCIIKYPYAQDTTSKISVTIYPYDKSIITFDNIEGKFCPGDSIQVHSSEYESVIYKWLLNNNLQTGLNTSQILIHQPSQIQQVLVNEWGCTDSSKILNVSYWPVPYPDLPYNVYYCKGDSGCFELNENYKKVLWSTGDTTEKIYINKPLHVSVKVWNQYNCSAADSTIFNEKNIPETHLISDTTLNYYSDIHLDSLCSHFNAYLWEDGSSDCERVVKGNELGFGDHLFTLKVISSDNCINYDSVQINVIFNKSYEPNPVNILFYPTVSDGNLNAYYDQSLQDELTSVKVFDMNGYLAKELEILFKGPGVFEIDLTDLNSGMYIVEISNSQIFEINKIVIIK